MSGNRRSGRTPKPLALHAIHGTHRRDRHGAIPDATEAVGLIVKPSDLSPDASATWDTLSAQLQPVLHPTDAHSLAMLCELLGLYRKALVVAQADPVDKPARAAVIAYASVVDRLAARFGLTPGDRARLKVQGSECGSKLSKYIDPMERMFSGRVSARKQDMGNNNAS